VFFLGSFIVLANPPANFQWAKREADKIFANYRMTLYCNCKFNPFKEIDLKSCHMEEAQAIKRAHRVEWEHIMPAQNFGQHFKCWQEKLCQTKGKSYKGKACCTRIDANFRAAEAELYNLWPAEGLINQARSNFRYATLHGVLNYYGCPFALDKVKRRVEPEDRIKGLVARANLFMSDKYGIRLSSSQRKLFLEWDRRFPPSSVEMRWSEKVFKVEGYYNPYIRKHEGQRKNEKDS
jgi:deoxyribonuclease-1